MKILRLNKQLSGRKIGFTPILMGFLILFSFGMALAIYFKLQHVAVEVDFYSVLLWQLAIWMPLVFMLSFFQLIFIRIKAFSRNKQGLFIIIAALIFIGLHFGWFYSISSTISPYLGLPKTKYGVYPFFFIFWIMIDFTLISGLVIYLKLSVDKETDTIKVKTPNTLYLKKGNKGFLLKPSDIFWIAAEDYYVKLFTSRGQFLERKPLKTLLTLLPKDQFIRIHRSTVVNINAITSFKSISSQKAEVSLKDGHSRIVSRTYLKAIKDLLRHSHF